MDWIDIKTFYLLLHLFGITLGAGGSFMSDVLFVTTTKDRILDDNELMILKKGSTVTWIGLFLLIISGSLLVSLDPQFYFSSDKFILKMIIVGIIIANGIIFHLIHTPRLKKLVGKYLSTSLEFRKYSKSMYYSGAISIVSWISALILGSLRMIPVSIPIGLVVYLVLISVAIVGAEIKRRQYLRN
ncbi:MAG: hypothetical protein ACJAV6_000012 [Candidatus Paceibacteria bacterium]|jgi:hypothetical protein